MKRINAIRLAIVLHLLGLAIGISIALPQPMAHAKTRHTHVTSYVSPVRVKQIITQVFGARYGYGARIVANCESHFNSNAYNPWSGAAGVFQFLSSTWRSTTQWRYSRFNAVANIVAAHEVFLRDGRSWREWQCRP